MIGAGADDLILLCARTFLAPGRSASIIPPTYSLYRIATQLGGAQAAVRSGRDVLLSPEQSDRRAR